jgi:SNF2 family DNA or RNA helicase
VLPFENTQRDLYRDVALSWNNKVGAALRQDGESKSQLLMLTALLRLRQACSDPAVLPGVTYLQEPPKVELLAEAIEQIIESGESALVFTQFLGTFERIQKRFKTDGVPCFAIHGCISRAQREKVLASFNANSGGAVLLMTLKTGGTGLNLTKASYVFHIEPWWNPAVENQASDRAHRMGQTRSVQVYRYLMEDSVEQKIESLKRRKAAHFDSLFGDVVENESDLQAGSRSISRSDFDYLLSP